jgi:aminoglycoside 2'-N-acetyltransferase I
MTRLSVAHTGQLEARTLTTCRALFDAVFGPGPTDLDWDHALGGVHALVWDGDELIAQGSIVQRRLLHRGRALRAGYVEGVAVAPERRRQGYGGAVMQALEEIARGAYDVGVLSASEEGAALYAARGWLPFRGATWAMTPEGVVRTPDEDDGVFVLPCASTVDLDGALTCDWRDGDLW